MSKIKQTVENTLSSDLLCRPEYIGGTTLLNPFMQHASAQRQMMHASHYTQRMNLNSPEQPRIMTGYEKLFGKYEFSTCRISQDSLIRRVIPKFDPIHYTEIAKYIPSWLVIYVGSDDRQVHCSTVSRYTMVHDGYGYMNQMLAFDNDMMFEGSLIPKDTKLTTSPSHKGNRYMAGVNANVVWLGDWGTTEDAFIVSDKFAEKCQSTAIQQIKLTIDYDSCPLNLYGRDGEYKCFPGVGEQVRWDGALLALRPVNKSTIHTDTSPSNLRTIEHFHDEVHRAPAGAEVIDVDVYISPDAERRLKDQDTTKYKQFFAIRDQHRYQEKTILQAYKQLCSKDGEGLPCSPEFHTQVVRSAMLSGSKEYIKKPGQLYDAREPVEFMVVIITYAYKRKLTLGSKLTDRSGAKGVVSEIRPYEDMPVDEGGVRADIIMTPASVINRMNPSQWLEAFWNRAGVEVIRTVKDRWLGGWKNHDKPEDWVSNMDFRQHWKEAFAYIIEFFHDFREAYAQFVCESLPTDNDRMAFTECCLNEGLYLINGFCKTHTSENLLAIAEKYGVKQTHLTYRTKDPKTGNKKTVVTRTRTYIGSKYMMVLGKLPSSQLSAIELGYVSQFKLPIKPKSKHVKSQAIMGLTPMKFGEDETCILTMSIRDVALARFYALHSSAPEIISQLGRNLLTNPHPTQFLGIPMHTQEVLKMNQNIAMFNHMCSVVGYSGVAPK